MSWRRLPGRKVRLLLVSLILSLVVGGWVGDRILLHYWGLGKPVLFYADPIVGFRPLPNREYHRIKGARLRFNNLSIRAERDWMERTAQQVLFLGDSVAYGGSYVDDHDLFSYRSVEGGAGGDFESGNAAVSAWGVDNIHGLVVESGFTPARNYVTVLTEYDFYRGRVRFLGQPFFSRELGSAYEELWLRFCYGQSARRWPNWRVGASRERTRQVVQHAVKHLQELHHYLTERGYRHQIFITPGIGQALGRAPRDPLVASLLQETDLPVSYLLDDVLDRHLTKVQIQSCYLDFIHLTTEGHHLWGEILAPKIKAMLDSPAPPVLVPDTN